MSGKAANVEEFSSKLSAHIWGHRFKDGQRGPEYVLEFLNVMYGTDYCLEADCYFRNKSVNLRKFVFEGVKEGSKRDTAQLDPDQKFNLYERIPNEERVEVIRDFLRNLEVPLTDGRGKEADRSWYARSLYPLHESLLFFELRTKGKIVSYERNFFARGGELFYLMVSYGTINNQELRSSIQDRLKTLLQKNISIEKIVSSIQTALGDKDISPRKDTYPLKKTGEVKEYPSLPVNDHPFFEQFASELNNLLNINVDVYEMFKFLTSLVSFQLLRYMYDRAKGSEQENIQFFFDCLDGKNDQILKTSASTFRKNETLIKAKFEEYFKTHFFNLLGDEKSIVNKLPVWKGNPDIFIELMGLKKLLSRKSRVINALNKCNNYYDVTTKLFNTVKEVISDHLKRHQLSIVRTLARDGGIGNYKTGTSYRYTMTDTFLQTLVFINVKPKESIEFSEFLEVIYQRYGFIIGEVQARNSGLYEQSKLNIGYYQKNEQALRGKLKKNGLLIEFSDATAMIRNPYEIAEGVAIG
jgi:hypothetical protein